MAYADYAFYKNSYLGNAVAEADFDRLSLRAGEYIDFITKGQAAGYEDKENYLKKACCAVAEVWQKNEEGGEVSGESVGPWSRTYAGANSKERALYLAAYNHLLLTGLLGRWL